MKKISFIAPLIMIVAILLNSCGREAPPPKADFTPPLVESLSPSDSSNDVAVNTTISVEFSEPLDEASVNNTTFAVNHPQTGPIPGVVTSSGKYATFKPLAALQFSTTYIVVITTGVRDKAGNNMFGIVNSVFTTGEYIDTIPPKVFSSFPTGSTVGVNTAIVVTFNESMNPFSFTTESAILSKSGDTTSISGDLQIGDLMVIFQPAKTLEKLTTYNVVIAGNVEDLSGNPMGLPYSWSFTTKDPDDVPPSVISTYPTPSAIKVPVTATITVSFSEAMIESSITSTTMVLTEIDSDGNTREIAGDVIASGATARMTPKAMLQYNTQYVVTLVPGWSGPTSGITDLAGLPLTENSSSGYTWTFRTDVSPSFFITATTGPSGTISPSGVVGVPYQGTIPFTITPATGYHIADVLVDGISAGTGSLYTFTNVVSNHTISATFAINNYTVTATAGANGTITPASRLVSHGSTTTFTVTPIPNYAAVMGGTCGGTLVGTTYTTNAITAPCTVTATFSQNTNIITATAGANGAISPSGSVAVVRGTNQTFTITPNTGYHVLDVLVDGPSVSAVTSYTFTNVVANHTISASFVINTYLVTATTGSNGTISPTSVNVNHGSTTSFTVTPSPGYTAVISGTCSGTLNGNIFTTSQITGPCTVNASFTLNALTVTATAGPGGTISPASRLVGYGDTTNFTVTPNTGYTAVMGGTCGGTLTGNTYNTNPITANCTVNATFTLNTYSVTATGSAGGTIAPASRLVSHGSTTTFTVTPNANYTAVMGGTCGGALVGTTYTTNAIIAPCTVTATFTLNAYTVTATAGANGTISPASVNVNYGSTTVITVTPNTGYTAVMGGTCGGALVGTTYTTNAIIAPCTVTATFTLNAYTVTATAGANGTISPASVIVNHGSTTAFTVTPNTGYNAVMGGTCGGSLSGTIYTTNPIIAPCTVSATFSNLTNIITATAGANGTISPSGAVAVVYGTNQAFTITPALGYHVADVLVDGVSAGAVTSYTFTNVIAPHTISASFAINTFIISASTGTGGTISPSGGVSVNYGANQTFTFTPDTGYHVAAITVDGAPVGLANSYTFTNVTAIHSIAVSFAINTYTITPTAGAGGTITPSTAVLVNYGGSRQFTFTAATGYHITDVLADGVSLGAVTSYTFTNVTTDHTISATFAINTFAINFVSGGNGTLTGTTSQTVNYNGSTTAVTAVPSLGYHFENWTGTGGFVTTTTNPLTVTNVTAAQTITANFAINTFAVNFASGGNGTLTGTTSQTVNYGGSATAVTAVPSLGYHFVNWTGTGGFVTTTTNPLTVTNVTAAQTITANFAINSYTVSTSAGNDGSFNPTSATVNHGSTTIFTVDSKNQQFYIASISGCGGVDYTNTNPTVFTYNYTTGPITGDCTVTATFNSVSLAIISATQGIGFGSLSAMSFLLNHKLFRNLFGRRRKRKENRDSPGNEG